MKLFKERVMGVIKDTYQEYITRERPGGEKVKGEWAFMISKAQRLFDEETDDVKTKVEKFWISTANEKTECMLDLDELLKKGSTMHRSLCRRCRSKQTAPERCP